MNIDKRVQDYLVSQIDIIKCLEMIKAFGNRITDKYMEYNFEAERFLLWIDFSTDNDYVLFQNIFVTFLRTSQYVAR